MSELQLRAITGTPVFEATRSPYMVVDRELRIRAVNPAYEQATGHHREQLVGRPLFEAFPDNPADPLADGVHQLGLSLESVFRRAERHSMGIQRYDVPDPQDSSEFVFKVWAPVNSPILDGARTIAALHHVEDVTDLLPADGQTPPQSRRSGAPSSAETLAQLAVAAQAARSAHGALQTRLVQLEQALETNRAISVALGVLMERTGVSQHEAFETLRILAARQHRKLREVALDILADRG